MTLARLAMGCGVLTGPDVPIDPMPGIVTAAWPETGHARCGLRPRTVMVAGSRRTSRDAATAGADGPGRGAPVTRFGPGTNATPMTAPPAMTAAARATTAGRRCGRPR